MLKRYGELLMNLLFLFDLAVICICWLAAYFIRLSGVISPVPEGMQPLTPYLWFLVPIVIAWGISAQALGLYRPQRVDSPAAKLLDVAKVNVLSVLVLLSLLFFIHEFEYSRLVVLYFWFLSLLTLECSRMTFRKDLRHLKNWGKGWFCEIKIMPILRNLRGSFINLALLATTTVVLLLVVEGILRLWPEMFGERFANTVLTKYNGSNSPRGIHYHDPVLKMHFMKPNFTTENYWNGYRWHHETDAFGFRNAQTRNRADILLLGDSLIYGHGVNLDETVGVLLERKIPYSVVNLGVQAYCAFQEAYLVTEYVPKFKPQYVFYFFFENDIFDVPSRLAEQEMNEFIRRDIGEISYKPRTDPNKLIRRNSLLDSLRPQLYLSYAKAVLEYEIDAKFKKDQTKPVVPDKPHDPNDEESLAWQYTKHAILYMDAVVKSHHARFVVAPITITNKRHYDILKNFAAQHELLFLEDSRVYEWDSTHFLPNDGHFTRKGAEALAEVVAGYLNHLDGSQRR